MHVENNKLRKKLKNYIALYGSIRMIDFLCDYVGVDSQFESLKNATHKDIRILNFEYVISVPFDILDNYELAVGDILLVEDCKHHIGAYRNPNRIEKEKNLIIKKKKVIK